jgi:hypothetical protein
MERASFCIPGKAFHLSPPNYHVGAMTDEELHARQKAYVMGWAETGRILERERRERVRQTDTARSLRALAGMTRSALWLHPIRTTSGLIEQQRIFAGAWKKSTTS